MKDSGEDDVCLVTNLPRYRCDHCIGTDAPARSQPVVRRVTTTARYQGHCVYCDGPIRRGEQIRRARGTLDWVHASHDLDTLRPPHRDACRV